MAYATANVSASELAARAKDYPLLIGRNWCRGLAGTAMQWRDTGSWAAGADDTLSTNPALCAGDDLDHERTGTDTAGSPRYFIVNYGSEGMTIDAVGIRNVYGCTASTVSVEIADNNAYGVNLLELATWSNPADGSNLIAINLPSGGGGPDRYSGVQYARVKVTGAAAQPFFGELILGRSRQWVANPIEPFDRRHLVTTVAMFTSDSGVKIQHVRRRKERLINCTLRIGTDTDETDYEGFWETDLDGGVGCFVWIDRPTTAPTAAWWMMFPEPEMLKPRGNYAERLLPFKAIEQGPNFYVG